tara:strand:+ start:10286 stop:10651 length:366 start_codon:yes stop_codon:yes gene_type:complete
MSARFDWTINQGETSEFTLVRTLTSDGSAVNFNSGATWALKVKDKFGGTEKLSLTSAASGAQSGAPFTHTNASNTVVVTLTADQTAAFDAPVKYVWDLQAIEGTSKTRIVEGALIVTPGVT